MVRILGFYLTGILLYELFGKSVAVNQIWIISGFLVLLYFLFQIRDLRKWAGVPGLLFIVSSGWILTDQFDESKKDLHLINHPVKPDYYLAVVMEQPEKTRKGYRLLISIRKVHVNHSWFNYHSKAYCHINNDNTAKPGDQLIIKGGMSAIRKKNSNEKFDYSLYLKRKNIFFQDYVSETEIKIIRNSSISIKQLAFDAQKWCLNQIKKFIPGKDEQAIAGALLVGYSGDLDPELNNDYAATGTLHILSVSGLHTGLLYWVILFLCKPLRSVKNGEWFITIIALAILWCYAMITGLAPSVLRAVIMLSFITISKPFGLRSNIWNTLASSAFLLLLFDPYLITRISFQLSYLAVAGIVWLHPLLIRSWEPESVIVSNGWNLTCVSIAAQLTTMPVTLLNFHQFPVWFIPANLILIPLSSIALFSSLAFLLLSVIPGLAGVAGWIVSLLIGSMNTITNFFGDWPLGPFEEIHITGFQAYCMMAMIIGFERFLKTNKFFWLFILLFTAILFSLPDLILP